MQSVRNVKQAKKGTLTVQSIQADVVGSYDDVAEPYTDVAGMSWWIVDSLGESLVDTWHYCGEWFGDTWPRHGLPRGTPFVW